MKNAIKAAIMASILFLASIPNLHAAAQLRLSDGIPANTVTVTDQDANDANPALGIVVYIGPVGPNWFLNVSSGTTQPAHGGPLTPYMDLGTTDYSSVGSTTLTVEFTDSGFLAAGVVAANLGGTTIGTVTYRTYADAGNANFAKTTLLTSQGPLAGPTFSGTANGVVGPVTPYSLTIETVINHPIAGQTGFDAELIVTPCTGEIGDFVWNDLNDNGCQDPNEPGIPNVLVELFAGCNQGGNSIRSTNTDASGKYLFSDLCAGDYTVKFTTPVGYTRTVANGACSVANLPPRTQPNQIDSDCSYNCAPTMDCGICVTLTANNSQNLTIDCGYVPVLSLNCAPGSTGQVGVPYSSGLVFSGGCAPYTFAIIVGALPPGLTLNLNTGVISGTPTSAGTYPYVAQVTDCAGRTADTSGQNCSITITPCAGQIGNYVWQDTDGDGCQDGGELGIPNVLVQLFAGCNQGGNSIRTTNTDASGKYLFTDLCPGEYTVSFTTPAGYTRTVANNGCVDNNLPPNQNHLDSKCSCASGPLCGVCVTLAANEVNLNIDCGYVPVLSLQCAPGSTGQVGVPYSSGLVFSGGCAPYTFAIIVGALPPGLTLNLNTGVISGTPTSAGSYPYVAQVTDCAGRTADTSGQNCSITTICNGQIGNFVWQDLNGNGCQDGNEPGLAGVKVELYSGDCAAVGSKISEQITTGTGAYLFSGLCPGNYQVKFTPPAGYAATTPLQNCALNGGDPTSNQTDSKCNCVGGGLCTVCVTLTPASPVNLNVDCGYVVLDAPCVSLFDDYLIIGMRPRSSGEAVTIGSSQEIGADRQTLSGDAFGSGPYISPVTPNITPAYPAPNSPDLRDVFFKDPSVPTNPSKNRWLWDAATQAHYLPGAAKLFRGVDWSGEVAVTSPSGSFSLQDINVFAAVGFRTRSTTAPVNVSNSRFFAANSLTGVLMDPIEGGGASQPTRGWIGGYDHDPLLAELRALRTFIRGLPKDVDFHSGNNSNPRDLVNRNTINAGGATSGPNTKLVYDLDALDVNGDGYAVIDIPSDGTDFEINNSDWILTDSNPGNGTPFAIFRIRGGANMNMSQSSIMAGEDFTPTFSGLAAAFVKVHPEEEFFSTSGSSDSVFTANNLVINRIGFWDLNTIGDANTDTDYSGYVNRTQQNNYTILSVNNGQGCGQFISGQVYMQNVRFVRCAECISPSATLPGGALPSAPLPTVPLPSPWSSRDIGTTDATGGAGYDSTARKFSVVGSGADIFGTADEFHYAFQPASGNCTIIARVMDMQNTDPWSKAGVMIREKLTSDSKHASIFVTPENGIAFQYRSSSPSGSSASINNTGFKAPYWLKIVRSSSTFTAYRSSNGSTWTQIGSKSISMSASVYIGLAVSSHNDGTLCTAPFQNVTATP